MREPGIINLSTLIIIELFKFCCLQGQCLENFLLILQPYRIVKHYRYLFVIYSIVRFSKHMRTVYECALLMRRHTWEYINEQTCTASLCNLKPNPRSWICKQNISNIFIVKLKLRSLFTNTCFISSTWSSSSHSIQILLLYYYIF